MLVLVSGDAISCAVSFVPGFVWWIKSLVMEVSNPSGEMEQEKVAQFMEIVGDSAERARQYLEVRNVLF